MTVSKIKKLNVFKDEIIGPYALPFSFFDVILTEYFFCPSKHSFGDENSLYDLDELQLTLFLTDVEYFLIVQRYFELLHENKKNVQHSFLGLNLNDIEKKLRQEIEGLRKGELKYNEAKEELEKIEKELESLEQRLNFIKEAVDQVDSVINSLKDYRNLLNVDLEKMHKDIVSIDNEIVNLEEQLENFKLRQIEITKDKFVFDENKKGFGVVLLIVMILSLALSVFIGWLVIVPLVLVTLIAFGFLFFYFLNRSEESEEDAEYIEEEYFRLESRINQLKNQKRRILSLVNLRSSKEFFVAKAQVNSYLRLFKTIQAKYGNVNIISEYKYLTDKISFLKSKKVQLENFLKQNISVYNNEPRQASDMIKQLNEKVSIIRGIKQFVSVEAVSLNLNRIIGEFSHIIKDFHHKEREKWLQNLSEVNQNIQKIALSMGINPFSVDKRDFFTLSELEKNIANLSFLLTLPRNQQTTIILKLSRNLANNTHFLDSVAYEFGELFDFVILVDA